ncbi:hypothetical protein ENUP19_0061G0082 [Entamoeba nuttalli]|uniref:EF-hand domain-containing protein n=1 Tax=Entamoeba nuttalli TaxID=412467 RepID=A0ABQ0DDI9_9EUKA
MESQLKDTFNEIDEDHDGIISFYDFLSSAIKYQVNVNQILQVFKEIDQNKDGKISLMQYMNYCDTKKYTTPS